MNQVRDFHTLGWPWWIFVKIQTVLSHNLHKMLYKRECIKG